MAHIRQTNKLRAGSASMSGGSGFAHGDSVTIMGSGFGTHPLAVEFVGGIDGHLESTALGNDASFGSWSLPTGAPSVTKEIASDAERGKVWRTNDVGASYYNAEMIYDYGANIPEGTKIYVSFWAKKDTAENTGQWKKLRIAYQNNISDQGTEIAFFNWVGGGASNLVVRPQSTTAGETTYYSSTGLPLSDGEWYRTELEITTSTQGVANGSIAMRTHGPSGISAVPWLFSGNPPTNIKTYDSALRFRWFLFQNYFGNGIANAQAWHDDHYIQVGTFKRVELCDSATYSASTVREIQKPTAWADGSVTVKLNKGGLPAGAYHLHVVGENNASLGSMAVTLV